MHWGERCDSNTHTRVRSAAIGSRAVTAWSAIYSRQVMRLRARTIEGHEERRWAWQVGSKLGRTRRIAVLLLAALSLMSPSFTFAAVGMEGWGEGSGSEYGYVQDAVMLAFTDHFPAASVRRSFAIANGLAEIGFTPLTHVFAFRITDGRTPDAVVDVLRNNPQVAWAAKIALGHREYVPPDALYPMQWYLPRVRMPGAWDLAGGGSTSYIALVDSGVQTNHPDLGVIAGRAFDGSGSINDRVGHGTWVAGIMAAFTGSVNGAIGIAGINYSAPILVAKDGDEVPNVWATAAGIEYAVQRGASAINVSTTYRGLTADERRALEDAVVLAWNAGQPVVAASGNDGTSFAGAYPAAFTKVITVGASTKLDVRAPFSNYGDASVPLYPNLVAPGVDMCTTALGSSYWCSPGPDGTSFAAPMVTGVIGLMRKLHPGIGSIAISNRLMNAADKVGGYGYTGTFCGGINVYMGCGRLDAQGAIN
jgi:thermitase